MWSARPPRLELRQQLVKSLDKVHSVNDHLCAVVEPDNATVFVGDVLEDGVEEVQPVKVGEASPHLSDGPLGVELCNVVPLVFRDGDLKDSRAFIAVRGMPYICQLSFELQDLQRVAFSSPRIRIQQHEYVPDQCSVGKPFVLSFQKHVEVSCEQIQCRLVNLNRL